MGGINIRGADLIAPGESGVKKSAQTFGD